MPIIEYGSFRISSLMIAFNSQISPSAFVGIEHWAELFVKDEIMIYPLIGIDLGVV